MGKKEQAEKERLALRNAIKVQQRIFDEKKKANLVNAIEDTTYEEQDKCERNFYMNRKDLPGQETTLWEWAWYDLIFRAIRQCSEKDRSQCIQYFFRGPDSGRGNLPRAFEEFWGSESLKPGVLISSKIPRRLQQALEMESWLADKDESWIRHMRAVVGPEGRNMRLGQWLVVFKRPGSAESLEFKLITPLGRDADGEEEPAGGRNGSRRKQERRANSITRIM